MFIILYFFRGPYVVMWDFEYPGQTVLPEAISVDNFIGNWRS